MKRSHQVATTNGLLVCFTLENFPADSGDVITKDGETIGTNTCNDGDFCAFTPNGAKDAAITDVFVGPFCRKIAERHEREFPD